MEFGIGIGIGIRAKATVILILRLTNWMTDDGLSTVMICDPPPVGIMPLSIVSTKSHLRGIWASGVTLQGEKLRQKAEVPGCLQLLLVPR